MQYSHSPQGECGLKLLCVQHRGVQALSLPTRGVRVEIRSLRGTRLHARSHSPQGECGLKWYAPITPSDRIASLPTRGVRVEIPRASSTACTPEVTPHKGSAG